MQSKFRVSNLQRIRTKKSYCEFTLIPAPSDSVHYLGISRMMDRAALKNDLLFIIRISNLFSKFFRPFTRILWLNRRCFSDPVPRAHLHSWVILLTSFHFSYSISGGRHGPPPPRVHFLILLWLLATRDRMLAFFNQATVISRRHLRTPGYAIHPGGIPTPQPHSITDTNLIVAACAETIFRLQNNTRLTLPDPLSVACRRRSRIAYRKLATTPLVPFRGAFAFYVLWNKFIERLGYSVLGGHIGLPFAFRASFLTLTALPPQDPPLPSFDRFLKAD
jgi:hypothetical protein